MRMRRLIGLIAFAAASNASGQALPAHGTTEHLLMMCRAAVQLIDGKTELDVADALTCLGYVQGYVDAVGLLGGKAACIPAEVTVGQIVQGVVKQFEAEPSLRTDSRGLATLLALGKTFPC